MLLLFIIIIIVIITTQRFSSFIKSAVTEQSLLIHYSAKNFRTVGHVLRIAAFNKRICRALRTLSSLKLSCNFVETIPIVDNTNTTQTDRQRSVAICFLALTLYMYISGAVEDVAVRKRNIYLICRSDDSVTHKYVWSAVRESSISCYEPVIICCMSSIMHVLVISII